jgi:glycosyltransferase involved in cell wall biosynthesis
VRILYVLTTLGMGGAEKQVVALAERMSARGHAVALLVLKHADEEWPVKLPVLRLNMRKSPPGVYRGLRFAGNFVTLFRPDIIHSHTFPANIFARLLRLMMLRGEMHPIVLNTIHNVYEGGWHRMAIYRLTDRLCDCITAVSAAAAERFIRIGAVTGKKVSVVTNGIDTGEFSPDRARRKRVRAQMNAGASFVWLAVGRMAEAKDYPNLLRAFAIVRSSDSDAQFWIAGEGTEAIAATDSIVRVLGLRRDIPDLLDGADGFVLASAWEGMPLVVGEAMAMEKPVVATNVGGVAELIGDAGNVVAPKDSSALAEAMLRLMHLDASARKFTGHAARRRIVDQFSMEARAGEWERMYAGWVAEQRS